MKYAKLAGVIFLIAAILAVPSGVRAEDTTPRIPENGESVDMTLDLGSNTASTTSLMSTLSPAGCQSSANDAHASHYYQGEIGYQATVIC